MSRNTQAEGGPLSGSADRLTVSPGRWSSAPGDLRAGYPPTDSAVESPPARPEFALPSNSRFLARMRLERALLSLQRRTAGRVPTRAERRLHAHYTRQLRALTDDPGATAP